MTQYHHLDDSGDPGLNVAAGSSSHFVLAMVQLPQRAPLPELAAVRKALHLAPTYEFKYYKTTPLQKEVFFKFVQAVHFRVRAVAVDKSAARPQFIGATGQDFTIEFILRLTLRASDLDIADDVLVIDGATLTLLRALRVRLSQECRQSGRVRPFKKIVNGDSRREDGLQLADMIAGVIRHYVVGEGEVYYRTFASKVLDLWEVPGQRE